MAKIFRASYCILALVKGVSKGKKKKVIQVMPQTSIFSSMPTVHKLEWPAVLGLG